MFFKSIDPGFQCSFPVKLWILTTWIVSSCVVHIVISILKLSLLSVYSAEEISSDSELGFLYSLLLNSILYVAGRIKFSGLSLGLCSIGL